MSIDDKWMENKQTVNGIIVELLQEAVGNGTIDLPYLYSSQTTSEEDGCN